jgi:hypothetical protein
MTTINFHVEHSDEQKKFQLLTLTDAFFNVGDIEKVLEKSGSFMRMKKLILIALNFPSL